MKGAEEKQHTVSDGGEEPSPSCGRPHPWFRLGEATAILDVVAKRKMLKPPQGLKLVPDYSTVCATTTSFYTKV
jgi:hypothetical protein